MSQEGGANKEPGNSPASYHTEDCWQFVNDSGRNESQSVQTRRLVRANATRAHWRAQRKEGLQSHTEGTPSSEGNSLGRAQASFVWQVHRNRTEAYGDHRMPRLPRGPAHMQPLSVEPDPPGLISGSVHSLTYQEYAVRTESQQGEHTRDELQLSHAAMQASTIPSPVTFGGGAIDVGVY